jgi:putative polyhydroxyalkanoate system protein
MADIDVHRVHNLGLAAARVAADKMAADLGRKFDLRGRWEGDVLHFERPGVQGALAIDAKALHLTVSLGFLLRAMKGSIERAVMGELEALFPERPAPAPPKTGPTKAKKGPARPKKGA